jgi:outer membrane protein OmpA-like peptidoglycan-associated protein
MQIGTSSNDTDRNARLAARVRRIVLSLPALIIGGLVLVYLLAGWFAFEPLVRWYAPKWVAERSGYRLQLDRARFNPLTLSVDLQGLALDEPDGKPLLKLSRLFVDFDSFGLFKRTWTFDEVRLERPIAAVEVATDRKINWLKFIDALGSKAPDSKTPGDGSMPRVAVGHFAMDKGRIDFTDHSVADTFKTEFDPLDLSLDDISTLPDDQGRYAVTAHTSIGADVRWNGSFGLNPITASGELAIDKLALERLWPYLERSLRTAPPTGKAGLSLSYKAGYANKSVSLQLDKVNAKVDGLALRSAKDPASAVSIDSLALGGGRVDLATRQVAFDSFAVRGGKVGVVRAADGHVELQDWFAAAPASRQSPPAAEQAPWRVSLGRASVESLAVRYIDQGFESPLTADVGNFKLSLQADASAGSGAPELNVKNLQLALGDIKLQSGKAAAPWFQLGRIALEDGSLKLTSHELGAARLVVSGGNLQTVRDAAGRIALLDAFTRAAPAASNPIPKPVATASGDAAWRYRIGKVEADKFNLSLRDESVSPAASFAIENLHAEAENLSEDAKAKVPLRMGLNVQSGGKLEASGSIVPATQAADMKLTLQGLAINPLRPYVAQVADLSLIGGQADTDGQLRYAAGQVRYGGRFSLRDLLINQAGSDERFLAWKNLSTRRVIATQQKLDIGGLELSGLDTKLVIFKDRTINVAKVFHPKAANANAAVPAPKPAEAVASKAAPYQVDVGRIRVVSGELDFTDLSLALPFAARIHDLNGNLAGLSTQPGRTAQIELAGQVDEYGQARAAGKLDLLSPTDTMDIKVAFRNVEMTSLTPYSATFAGRKIDSGKLSLDLDYTLDKRQLKGENKVVMDRLKLGERVESPTAVDLPLDLALALLQDSDGRIELGLPVSGSLDDPQFSYGSIIWKAFVNVLAKAVTSPFRAIGGLLGHGNNDDDKAPEIVFDAGSAELQPPEQEKLDVLANAISKRPGLSLAIASPFDRKSDSVALNESVLRRQVAQELGRPVREGENPGPVSTTQPRVQQALEALFAKAFGRGALETLRSQHQQANPPPAGSDAAKPALGSRISKLFKPADKPLNDDEKAKLQGTDLYALMKQRLLEQTPADDAELAALASRRAEAIRLRVVSHGVPAERVQVGPPGPQAAGDANVRAKLDIAAAGNAVQK